MVDRVIRQRRDSKQEAASDPEEAGDQRRIAALAQRVEELEALLEALQDSIHREMTRLDRELRALAAGTTAPEMARALDRYSRERGL